MAAFALTDHDAEAHEALQPLPRALHRIVQDDRGMEGAPDVLAPKQGGDPRFVEMSERSYDGLRKAGMPEE